MGRAPRLIVASVLLSSVLLVTVIWGPDWADHSLGVFLFFVWLVTSKEYPDFIDLITGWLSRRSSGSRFAASLKRIVPAFSYSDLSLVLASVILLGVGVSKSFVAAVQDLAAKGFLSFDPQMAGFVHLQLYIIGYITTLPLVLTCAAYGFYRGLRDGRTSFPKLLVAILLGVLIDVLLMSAVHGGFTGGETLKIVNQKTSASLPSGASPTSPINLMSAGLTIWLGFAALAWIFSLLGRLVKHFLLRSPAPPRDRFPDAER